MSSNNSNPNGFDELERLRNLLSIQQRIFELEQARQQQNSAGPPPASAHITPPTAPNIPINHLPQPNIYPSIPTHLLPAQRATLQPPAFVPAAPGPLLAFEGPSATPVVTSTTPSSSRPGPIQTYAGLAHGTITMAGGSASGHPAPLSNPHAIVIGTQHTSAANLARMAASERHAGEYPRTNFWAHVLTMSSGLSC